MESRRDSLIEAAARLLDAGGPAAVTLRDVGRAAGVSHNAPYRHFADKDALLAAVASRELAGNTPPEGAQPQAKAMIKAYVAWALRRPERFRLVFGRWNHADDTLGDAADDARSALIEAVKRAQTAGDLPAAEPERLTALLLALAHGAADLALSGHLAADGKGQASPQDLVEDLFAYLKTSAGPPRASGSG